MGWIRTYMIGWNPYRLFVGMTFLIVSSWVLVGCSDCTKSSYDAIPTTQSCDRARILITNLMQLPDDRSYQLPSGQDCTRVVRG